MTLAAWIVDAAADREAWRYTSLAGLSAADFAPAQPVSVPMAALPPLLDGHGQRLVFVNGHYQPQLSMTMDLPPDIITGDAVLGYRLTVQAQTCLATQPLEVLCLSHKASTPRQSTIKLQLQLGAHARLTLLERHISIGSGAPQVTTVQIGATLAEQAKALHLKCQEQATDDTHLARTTATLAKGAFYDHCSLTLGAVLSRNELVCSLKEPEAQARLSGATLLRGSQHGATLAIVHHTAPHTVSEQHFRAVLDDKARGVFQGKIAVERTAQQMSGRQLSRALLLSGQAEADHKPELEVNADNVQCSHGSTIGQLDDAALFYLRSRGVAPEAARALLVGAFVQEVLETIGSKSGRDYAAECAAAWHGVAA